MHTFCLHSNKSRCLWGSFFPVCYMLALKFACTSDEVLHGVDCCRGRSGGGGAWWDCASTKHGGLAHVATLMQYTSICE